MNTLIFLDDMWGIIHYMSIPTDILDELWSTSLRYKGIRVNVFGFPKLDGYSRRAISTAIYQLEKRGLIHRKAAGIILSLSGKKYAKKRLELLKQFSPPKKIKSTQKMIVMFDIPVRKKIYRDWLRTHLKKFDYRMIQHSVWIGPLLPEDFLAYIKLIELDPCIKTFKINTRT